MYNCKSKGKELLRNRESDDKEAVMLHLICDGCHSTYINCLELIIVRESSTFFCKSVSECVVS